MDTVNRATLFKAGLVASICVAPDIPIYQATMKSLPDLQLQLHTDPVGTEAGFIVAIVTLHFLDDSRIGQGIVLGQISENEFFDYAADITRQIPQLL